MYHLKFWFTPSRKGGVGRRKLCEIPKTLTVDGTTISNPMEISNIFNNYFSSIASKTKLNISFSHKHYSDFLKNRSDISFFVSPTDKTEMENIISWLDSKKSVGPNSFFVCFFLIGIHSMQGWTATMRHGFTRKEAQKRLQYTENLFRKNLQLKDVC